MDLKKFQKIVNAQCGVKRNSAVIVGVSGGPDSLALLDLLNKCGIKVIAAHFNHQLRSAADDDETKVRNFSVKRKIIFEAGRRNIKLLAVKNKRSIEEQARISRYEFLFSVAKKYHAGFVAVGHNADDQVETILMHLLRGSGLDGLCGMQVSTQEPEWGEAVLIRPLLPFWRIEIDEYCKLTDLQPVHDASNQESIFFRNRIRNELIPYLLTFNSKVKMQLYKMAEVLKGEKDIINFSVKAVNEKLKPEKEKELIRIDFKDFSDLPIGLQREVLRMYIKDFYPQERDIDFDLIERGRSFLKKNLNGSELLFGNLVIEKDGESIFLKKGNHKLPLGKYPQIEKAIKFQEIPVSNELNAYWQIEISEVTPGKQAEVGNEDPFQAFVDADKLKQPLIARISKPGDRFAPLGMKGKTIKLSDFWINRKLPRKYRGLYPLISDQERIVWIPGFQPSEDVRMDGSTKRILKIEVRKKGS